MSFRYFHPWTVVHSDSKMVNRVLQEICLSCIWGCENLFRMYQIPPIYYFGLHSTKTTCILYTPICGYKVRCEEEKFEIVRSLTCYIHEYGLWLNEWVKWTWDKRRLCYNLERWFFLRRHHRGEFIIASLLNTFAIL